MKKYIAALLAGVLLFSLSCCGEKENAGRSIPGTTQEESTTPEIITPEINQSTQIAIENEERDGIKTIITGVSDGNYPSGFAPLPAIHYERVSDSTELSAKKVSHSHGPASGGEPHHTVVEFQKLFDKYGAVTLDTSGEKTLYLTFDCGYEYENLTSRVLDVLKEKGVCATFFCTLDHIKAEHELIARMIKEGHIVGNHSTTHPSFAEISRNKMVEEIEQTENYLRENFGYAAKFFRFPAGEYNESALEVVSSLGYCSVFWSVAYDDWDTKNIRGKDYAVEKVISRLHDGAVILLHSVSRDNADALGEIIDKAREQGYEFKSLGDI